MFNVNRQYICIWYVHARSTNNLDSAMNCTFHADGESCPWTNAAVSSIAHTLWKKRKQIKEKAGMG